MKNKQKAWRRNAQRINCDMGQKHQGRKFKNDPRMADLIERIAAEKIAEQLAKKKVEENQQA